MPNNEIINFYELIPKKYVKHYDNPYYKDHLLKIPSMSVIVAGSGSGKSNLIMNILERFHGFESFDGGIWILTKNKDEPLYNALSAAMPEIKIAEVKAEKTKNGWVLSNLPDLDKDFDTSKASLIIFDDLVAENAASLESVEKFYIRARKKGASCMFLSQSYFKTPKTIRLNLHYLFVLKLSSDRDLNLILSEYSIGVSRDELLAMYEYSTHEKFNFLLIDIGAEIKDRYRHNFSQIFDLSN